MNATISLLAPAQTFKTVIRNDARHLQIILQFTFLLYGILFLDWYQYLPYYTVLIAGSLFTQYIFTYFTDKNYQSLKSAFISSLSLSLILKSTSLPVLLLAAFLTIASKYIFRYRKKHFFNPSNFGIIATILFTGQAWVSPGQWGSDLLLAIIILFGGTAILLKVKRIDAALTFIFTYGVLHYIRIVGYYGWDNDVFWHTMSNGTLLLFSFFMITDPKSSPNARQARVIWAFLIAVISFIVSAVYYVYDAPLWVLFVLSPATVLFDKFFKHPIFQW